MNVLERIVADKNIEVERLKLEFQAEKFEASLKPSTSSLKESIKADKANYGAGFILEVKQASPSKGLIRADFNLDEICTAYKPYASAISVLTDKKYFSGNFERINQVKTRTSLPVLCKDFFVDVYQVQLARYHGADAILLMLSVLNDEQYIELADVARKFNLDILTEVSNKDEMHRAITLGAEIIGINNRNLRDLSTDLTQTQKLKAVFAENTDKAQQQNTLIISESGIYQHQQVKSLSKYCDGFLVGSSLMAQADLDKACHDLVIGTHKVCGVKSKDIINQLSDLHVSYIGHILVPESIRFIDPSAVSELYHVHEHSVDSKNQRVLVSKDLSIAELLNAIDTATPAAVQLHGDEKPQYICELRDTSKQPIQIWKVIHCKLTDSAQQVVSEMRKYHEYVDGFVLDSFSSSGQKGGTGETFDWTILESDLLISEILQPNYPQILLAGGIYERNIHQALSLPINGLDLNSGVEAPKGVKCPTKIKNIFNLINKRILSSEVN